MQEKGLGTPATRAAIIEGLIYEKYIHREGRELVPGAKAFQLMTLLRGLGVEDLTKPELTGNWEYQLAEMEKGQLERETFMAEIAEMAERIVARPRSTTATPSPATTRRWPTPCPNCGGVVKENYRRFACTGKPAPAAKAAASRSARSRAAARFELDEVEAIPAPTRRSGRSRASAPRRAGRSPPRLKLAFDDEIKNWKLEFDFGEDAKARRRIGEPVDFSAQESLGACPKCAGPRLRARQQLRVRARGRRRTSTCDFKSGKIILQQPVAREQMTQAAGHRQDRPARRTSSPTRRGASSRRAWPGTRRKARSMFEFEPRPGPRPPAKKARRAAAAGRQRRRLGVSKASAKRCGGTTGGRKRRRRRPSPGRSQPRRTTGARKTAAKRSA